MSEDRVQLTREQVVRHVLGKHHLLGAAGRGELVRVVDDLVGLHGTSATSPYLSLQARVRGFAPAQLDRELYQRRSLFRLKGMRGTVFVLSRQLGPMVFAATHTLVGERDRRWLRLDEAVYQRLAPAVLRLLAGRSLTTAELRTELGTDADLSAVVALLSDEGRIVRDQPRGSRKSTVFRYRLWEEAFPDLDLAAGEEAAATRLLVRQYLGCYGPATLGDAIWWSGIPAPRIRQAVAGLGDELVEVEVTDLPGRLLAIRDDLAGMPEARRAWDPATSLLPELDPYVMGYRDRDRYLDPRHADLVFDRGGNATSVVLLDGRVVGVWDLVDRPEPAVRLLLFDPELAARGPIKDRAAAVGAFWFGEPRPVLEYASMVPLTKRSGVMRRPLDQAQAITPRR